MSKMSLIEAIFKFEEKALQDEEKALQDKEKARETRQKIFEALGIPYESASPNWGLDILATPTDTVTDYEQTESKPPKTMKVSGAPLHLRYSMGKKDGAKLFLIWKDKTNSQYKQLGKKPGVGKKPGY